MDTIAAISTARGAAGIGVVRLSGEKAISAADAVFSAKCGRSLAECESRKMYLGALMDRSGRIIDNILAVVFRAGESYTGEDMAELHCHGSPVVLNECLAALLENGARQAKAGEFTKRAFLNGRMDLTGAEAVADLIDAETAEAARTAASQLGGALLRPVEQAYGKIMDVASRFYAVVDYPDEDIEDVESADIGAALTEAESILSRLMATAERGRIVKHGLPAAIIGKPNVGKSSLLNALLGFDRAIVTDVAGTTRDTVEEKVLCGGVLLRLADTAGMRETDDVVEKIGVERAKAAAEQARLVLVVLDGSREIDAEDMSAVAEAERAEYAVAIINKCDLPRKAETEKIGSTFSTVCELSAKNGEGLDKLEKAISEMFPAGDAPVGEMLTNDRQCDAVRRALDAVKTAREAFDGGMTADVVLTDAEEAMAALGELTGKSVREDIVETIFSRFCVGK